MRMDSAEGGAETSTDPSPSGAFCFLTLISVNRVARGAKVLERLLAGPLRRRALCRRRPCRGRWPRARGCLAPVLAGQAIQGRETHTLFIFGFVNGRQDFGAGAGEPALRWLPACRGPRPFALKGGPGPPRARLPPLPFQNLIQCSLVWGQGRERALVRGCYCVLPALTPHHKGFLRSPVPRQRSLSGKRACTCG